MDGWISCIKTMMLDSQMYQSVKTGSISDVPQQLRKSKMEAYMPMVSIGPKSMIRRNLPHLEKIKWSFMRFLLQRTSYDNLNECSEAIYELNGLIRASYVDDFKLSDWSRSDLAKIMLLDGCFLLELLISNDEQLDKTLRRESTPKVSPAAEFGKVGPFLSDLKLLENQIPMFIIFVLLKHLAFREFNPWEEDFSKHLEENDEDFQKLWKKVSESVMSLFSCSSVSSPVDCLNYAHFLDLVHRFMTREEENNHHHLSITMDGNGNRSINSRRTKPKQTLQLKRCAVRLEAVGVTIGPLLHEELEKSQRSMLIMLEDGKEVIFGYDKKFNQRDGKLEIQPLNISKITEAQWRSLTTWEQNEENQTPCKFSQYALLFKDLVCCEHDIQVLKDRGVLLVDDGEERSNEDLMILFQEIARGIEIHLSGDDKFRQLIHDLNAYSGSRGNRSIFWHRLKSIKANTWYTCRESFVILKRDYTPNMWKTLGVIAAIVLLVLTIAQTILAAIGL